jgi:hypothetical protein
MSEFNGEKSLTIVVMVAHLVEIVACCQDSITS